MKPVRFIAFFVTLLSLAAQAGDWPQWRGPHFNGSADEKNLPATWTKESAKWTLDLPGAGAATPSILGDRIYLSAPDATAKTLHALAIDRKSGKVIWNKQTGDAIGFG